MKVIKTKIVIYSIGMVLGIGLAVLGLTLDDHAVKTLKLREPFFQPLQQENVTVKRKDGQTSAVLSIAPICPEQM